MNEEIRRLVIVLGDQLTPNSAAFKHFDPERDRIWMAEAREEATHVWSSKMRIAYFLSAMRHFRDELESKGYSVAYHTLKPDPPNTLAEILAADLNKLRPEIAQMVPAGDFRVHQSIEAAVLDSGIHFECLPDNHFMCEQTTFNRWAENRKQLRLEYFYRFLRKRHGVLMDDGGPEGGKWNYDSDNRQAFSKHGPGMIPPWPSFAPDRITRGVIKIVEKNFPDHPGDLSSFDWPVSRRDARDAMNDFIQHRLAMFGPYQDAMWSDEPFLYHSGLAAPMNLKLISPRKAVAQAVDAYDGKHARLASVEGFIRQILLEVHARIRRAQRAAGGARTARVLLDGRYRHGMPQADDKADSALWIRTSYPTFDGNGFVCPPIRCKTAPGTRVVSVRLCRRGRVGRAAESPGYVTVRGWWNSCLQTLCRQRTIYR